jgi:lipoyl(octanoyl) transferase
MARQEPPAIVRRVELRTEWLGRIDYRDAWALQHDRVAARQRTEIPDTLLLLEHAAVLTLGRSANRAHVLVDDRELATRGIELLPVERGGDVTYHGPGQLVAYPIVRLADAGLLLRPFVRALEAAMADLAATYGVVAGRREGYPGCWVAPDSDHPRKLGALGLKVERGVSYHGIAINITTRLADFELIDPCGMPGLDTTSIARELGWTGDAAVPSTASVEVAGRRFAESLASRLDEGAAMSRPLVPAS